MNVQIQRARLTLPKGDAITLANVEGNRVTCQHGTLWITQDGDPRDIILGHGQSFAFDRDGVALVFALSPSALQLC